MLIKISGITLETADIHLIVPRADGKSTLFLSTTEGGRTATLDEAAAARLDLFLTAAGLLDLDGPGFLHSAYEKAAQLRGEAQALEIVRTAIHISEQVKDAQAAISTYAARSSRLPPEPPEPPASTDPPLKTGPSLVPPRPPLPDDDFNPDPMQFIARGKPGGIKGPAFIQDL